MKTFLSCTILSLVLVAGAVHAQQLTEKQQREIIQNYMYITGQSSQPGAALAESLDEHHPIKCGTPYILQFMQNRDKLDKRLIQEMGAQSAMAPPTMQYTYGSPLGHVLIHYDKTGFDACWEPEVDTDGDGVPNYIERIGEIADSSYIWEFDTLAMPLPENDSTCFPGGDSRIDIYLYALPAGVYGLTYGVGDCESDGDYWTVPSWIMIDNDFQEIPEYVDNPIPAAQVTIAHEMFHTSHFAMDWTEHSAWFEMTAVWMEEQVYDAVDDYKLYDYVFYEFPEVSLCDTNYNHQYQSVVWPLYLTKKYGRNLVKEIWLEADTLGHDIENPDFLRACDSVIRWESVKPENTQYRCSQYSDDLTECLDSVAVPQTFATALNEFAVWNFFTGSFADQAPNGMGFEEAADYDEIPITTMAVERIYPAQVLAAQNPYSPQVDGAMYLRLDNLGAIETDTLGLFPDSLLSTWLYTPDTININWGLAGMFQLKDRPDSFVVMMTTVPYWSIMDSSFTPPRRRPGRYVENMLGQWVKTSETDSVRVLNIKRFSTVTFVLTPSWTIDLFYETEEPLEFGYQVNNFSTPDDSRMNLAGAVLTPYPNPAVLSEMQGEELKFRFQMPTDGTSFPTLASAYLMVDVFSVAGERVRTIEQNTAAEDRGPNQLTGIYEIPWDLKNDAGKEVASGVYLAVARLYESESKASQLAEDRVKVAVIR